MSVFYFGTLTVRLCQSAAISGICKALQAHESGLCCKWRYNKCWDCNLKARRGTTGCAHFG